MRDVVILAGGKGTRLAPYTTVLPKPLLPVGDRPILQIVVQQLRHFGFRRLILAVRHLDGLLRSYFGDGSEFDVELSYCKEDRPLGTVGPLRLMMDELSEEFLLMNGDVLTDLDFRRFFETHRESGCALSLCRHQREVAVSEGVLEVDAVGRITRFEEKPTFNLWVSMGVYALNRSVLRWIPDDGPFGMDQLVAAMLRDGAPVNTYGHEGEWYDIGSSGDLERAKAAFTADPEHFLGEQRLVAGVA